MLVNIVNSEPEPLAEYLSEELVKLQEKLDEDQGRHAHALLSVMSEMPGRAWIPTMHTLIETLIGRLIENPSPAITPAFQALQVSLTHHRRTNDSILLALYKGLELGAVGIEGEGWREKAGKAAIKTIISLLQVHQLVIKRARMRAKGVKFSDATADVTLKRKESFDEIKESEKIVEENFTPTFINFIEASFKSCLIQLKTIYDMFGSQIFESEVNLEITR